MSLHDKIYSIRFSFKLIHSIYTYYMYRKTCFYLFELFLCQLYASEGSVRKMFRKCHSNAMINVNTMSYAFLICLNNFPGQKHIFSIYILVHDHLRTQEAANHSSSIGVGENPRWPPYVRGSEVQLFFW